MALRDQPYLPLYVQDFLTDEKLIECSAQTTGVYIRLMCIMHKSEEYGIILLKQKDKQDENQIRNFALKLLKQMPYSLDIIFSSLTELVEENVLVLSGEKLCQKRMVKDNDISEKRSLSGSKGGKFTQAKIKANAKANAKAKVKANTEYVNEDEIAIINDYLLKFNEIRETKFRSLNVNEQKTFLKTLKDYSVQEMIAAYQNATTDPYHIESGFKYLTPEFFTRPTNIAKFLSYTGSKKPSGYGVHNRNADRLSELFNSGEFNNPCIQKQNELTDGK